MMVGHMRTLMLEKIAAQYQYSIGIHAAAVLTSDNKALLFSAPSGFGKSTLSVFLALNGNDSLGDDSLIVDLDSSIRQVGSTIHRYFGPKMVDGSQVGIGKM